MYIYLFLTLRIFNFIFKIHYNYTNLLTIPFSQKIAKFFKQNKDNHKEKQICFIKKLNYI